MSSWYKWGVTLFQRCEPNGKPYHKIFLLSDFPDCDGDVRIFHTMEDAEEYVRRLVERGESNGTIF